MLRTDPYLVYLCLFLTAVGVMSIPFQNGFTLWDEGSYVNLAIRLAHGTPISVQENLFANRFGTYLLPALYIKLFGFSENITWIFTGLFIMMLAAIYFCLRYNKQLAFFTMVLLGTSPILMQESSRVMSDVLGGFTATAPILLYLYYLNNPKSKSLNLALLAGFIFAYSVITRESFVFLVPAMIWLTVTGRQKAFWITTAAVAGCIGALIILAYWAHNDLSARIHTIYTGHITESCGYSTAPFYEKLKRITYQPFQLLTENYSYGVLLLFAGLNFLGPKTKDAQVIRPFLIITLLVFWFCPETLTLLNPVPLAPRLWMPLIIPLAINAGSGLQQINNYTYKQKQTATIFTVNFMLAAVVILCISKNEHQLRGVPEFTWMLDVAYLVIGTLLIITIWVQLKLKTLLLLACVCMSQLAALFAGRLIGNSAENAYAYRDEKKALLKLAKKTKTGDYIITDSALNTNHIIYGDILNVHFLDFDFVQPDTLPHKTHQVFLYLNKQRVNMFRTNHNETSIYTSADYRKLPDFVVNPGQYFRLIDSTNTYKLYVLK